jgi:hypothetical protein
MPAAQLLDRTAVFLGSNLGDGSSHSTKNLPVLLAGGGFKHGQHLAFNPDNPPPLCNLYVSMLQHLGIETDQFSTANGTLTGLDWSGRRDSNSRPLAPHDLGLNAPSSAPRRHSPWRVLDPVCSWGNCSFRLAAHQKISEWQESLKLHPF